MKNLVWASAALLAMQVLHTLDHILGHPANGVGVIPGYLGFATVLGALYLAARSYALAPLACAATGFFTAAGLVAIHLAPHWGVFSDPYSKLDLGFASWAIVFASIVSALVLGVLGAREMAAQRARGAQPAT